MPRQLSDFEVDDLTGGGVSTSHYHVERPTHETILQLQDQSRIVFISDAFYDASPIDDVIVVDTSAHDVLVSLPAVLGQKEFTITKAATANTLNIVFLSGTCFGFSSFYMTLIGQAVRFKAYQGNWITV